MSDDQRQTRIMRRDEDMRRLRQLTIAAGVLGVGLFATASIVAANSQPGHAIATTSSSDGTSVQTPSQAQPAFQQPASAPFGRHRSRAVAISGGS